MSDVRILAHTVRGAMVVVAVEGDELPVGGFDQQLYGPVRLYHPDRAKLTEPLWLGSVLKFVGGYLEEPALSAAEEARVLAGVAELLQAR